MFGIKHGSVDEVKKLLWHQSYIYVVSKVNTCLHYKTLYTHAHCFSGLRKTRFSASLPSSSHLHNHAQGIFWKIVICWFCTWWPVHIINVRPSTGTWVNWWDGCTCVNHGESVLHCLVCELWLPCTSLDTCCHSRHRWVSNSWESTGLLRLCCWRCLHHTPWHSCNNMQEKSTRVSQNHVKIVHKNLVSFIVLFVCYLTKSECITVAQKLAPVLV